MGRMDAINKELKQKESGFTSDRHWYINTEALDKLSIKQYKATEGDNFLRILPPLDPEAYFGLAIFVHYNLGPDKNDAFLCPRMMKKERCVICERQDALKAKGVEDTVWKKLGCFPPRYLYLARDCKNDETMDEGTQLYDAPQTVNNEILTLSKDRRSGEVVDVSDPDDGKLLVFTRTGMKATNTRYSGFELEKDDPIPEEWLDNLPELEDCLQYASEEDMLKALGLPPEEIVDTPPDGEKEDTPEPPARSGRRERTRTSDVADTSAEKETPKDEKEDVPKNDPEPSTRRTRRSPDREVEKDAPADTGKADDTAGDDSVKSRLRERLAKRKS